MSGSALQSVLCKGDGIDGKDLLIRIFCIILYTYYVEHTHTPFNANQLC